MDIQKAHEVLEQNKTIDTSWNAHRLDNPELMLTRYEFIKSLHMTGYYLTTNRQGKEVLRSFSKGYPQESSKWMVNLWKAYCAVHGSETMFIVEM